VIARKAHLIPGLLELAPGSTLSRLKPRQIASSGCHSVAGVRVRAPIVMGHSRDTRVARMLAPLSTRVRKWTLIDCLHSLRPEHRRA